MKSKILYARASCSSLWSYDPCGWGSVQGILRNLSLRVRDVWSHRLGVRAIFVVVGNMFLFTGRALAIVFVSFDPWELACALLGLDSWLAHGPMSNCVYSYVVL